MKRTLASLILVGGMLAAAAFSATPASADEDLTIHYPVNVANAMANQYLYGGYNASYYGGTSYGAPGYNAGYYGGAQYGAPGCNANYYGGTPYPSPGYSAGFDRRDPRGWMREAQQRYQERMRRNDRRHEDRYREDGGWRR